MPDIDNDIDKFSQDIPKTGSSGSPLPYFHPGVMIFPKSEHTLLIYNVGILDNILRKRL
jgi:hypothetical protein